MRLRLRVGVEAEVGTRGAEAGRRQPWHACDPCVALTLALTASSNLALPPPHTLGLTLILAFALTLALSAHPTYPTLTLTAYPTPTLALTAYPTAHLGEHRACPTKKPALPLRGRERVGVGLRLRLRLRVQLRLWMTMRLLGRGWRRTECLTGSLHWACSGRCMARGRYGRGRCDRGRCGRGRYGRGRCVRAADRAHCQEHRRACTRGSGCARAHLALHQHRLEGVALHGERVATGRVVLELRGER